MPEDNNQISSSFTLNEELEIYFANTIIIQLFVDTQLVLRKFTPLAMTTFRLKQEYIGKHLDEIYKVFKFPEMLETIKTVMSTGVMLDKEIQTADLNRFHVNILPYLIRKRNHTKGVIMTFVDIPSKIGESKEPLHLTAEHKVLINSVAHDIKNLMLGLSLTFQMLTKLPDNSYQQKSLLLNAEKSLDDLKTMTADLESRLAR